MAEVRLRCVKEGGKLRVKIISPGYNPHANCQFPRDIRLEGREYIVPADDISFSESAHHKFFYRVKKSRVRIAAADEANDLSDLRIYEDTNEDVCCVCLDANKSDIFYPCGHYYCCNTCAMQLLVSKNGCPICRTKITQIVSRDQLQ